MDLIKGKSILRTSSKRCEWRFGDRSLLVILYITLFALQTNCQNTESSQIETITKRDVDINVDSNHCHSCQTISNKFDNDNATENKTVPTESEDVVNNVIITLSTLTKRYFLSNTTENELEKEVESIFDKVLSNDRYEIIEGIEIKPVDKEDLDKLQSKNDVSEGRALFSKYTYEYRMLQKFKNFVENHVLSINLPKAAKFMGFRSFGLNKFFVPLLIGGQVLIKSILFAMFLPSILGSFGKILGKGISQLSATSSQASYPPANADDQAAFSNDNKDFMGYETNPAGAYAYPQDANGFYNTDPNDNDLSNVDMSRYGDQKASYLPTKNGYYQNQINSASNNFKVFHKIPASSMILSNYDPFYSPLLSRLDGIFARLGLAPSETLDGGTQIGGQSLSDVKLESCREQLICLMYASPAKYAPYSNLVSAQLSRELNELRRPVSDNPEILRFFRYMRAARRGQEGVDCMRAHPACSANAAPAHTMIAAYQDINKLVTARKIKN
ncbi:protein Osi24 [Aphomia sociella]